MGMLQGLALKGSVWRFTKTKNRITFWAIRFFQYRHLIIMFLKFAINLGFTFSIFSESGNELVN
jgi:hypothetical protein